MKIAIIAPPWLSTGPRCYFGIENMVHYLTVGLTNLGHHVELFTVGSSTSPATKLHWYHKDNQYPHIHRPYYQTSSIVISHVLYALNTIRDDGNFDIIHDHNDFIGPAIMAYANGDFPPVLHTIHEPFSNDALIAKGIPDNRLMYEQFKRIKHMYFNCVSKRQIQEAPDELKKDLLGVVYNGIDPADYIYNTKKQDFFLSIGSISHDKGQAVGAKLCHSLGEKLKLTGIVGGKVTSPEELKNALADKDCEAQSNSNFKYFVAEILPLLSEGTIEYLGIAPGDLKLKLLSQAKALLAPIQWEEPFGITVIEALASGTPVVTFHRGAMPETIEHGVNGFMAKTEAEFKQYMQRVGEIDPEACRKSVEKKFSSDTMARNYLKLYARVLQLA